MNSTTINRFWEVSPSMDFSDQVSSFYDDYVSFIKDEINNINDNLLPDSEKPSILAKIEDTINQLRSFYHYFDLGDNKSCYEIINSLYVHLKENLISSEHYRKLRKNTEFYRVRTYQFDNPPTHDSKFDLFHIPFRKRHKVSNLRFNPPGIPCLYCAAEITTAVKEMRLSSIKLYRKRHSVIARNSNNMLNVGKFLNKDGVWILACLLKIIMI